MGQGYWRNVRLRALKDTRHELRIETGGRAVIVVLLAVVALAAIWLLGGKDMAASDLIARAALALAILVTFPVVYLWKFATAPAKMAAEQDAKIADFTATRAALEVRIGSGDPYEMLVASWVHRRFCVFNLGPAIADEITVQLLAIHPRPNSPGILDFPLNVQGVGGLNANVFRLKPRNEAIFSVLEACPEALGPDGVQRWQANHLGHGLRSMPSIFLECGQRWEFDYVLQAANADDFAFTLTVRADAQTIYVTKKA
jgi:hypothetical protein